MPKTTLNVLTKEPEYLEIVDEKLAAELESYTTHVEASDYPVLHFSKIAAAKDVLYGWKSDVVWLEGAIDDAVWARSNQWMISPEPSAWLVDVYMVIQAPYTLTMSDNINQMGGGYRYSKELSGWIVNLNKANQDIIEATLDVYGISASNNLGDALEGRIAWRATIAQLVQEATDAGFRLPDPDVFETSREYKWWQKEGIMAMALQGTSLLTDQVGLGKGGSFIGTSLTVNQYRNKTIKNGQFPVVIAVTKSMKSEIAEEALRWWSGATVEIISGTKPAELPKGKDFYIINHDILAPRVKDLMALKPEGFIADECHVYKNGDSARSKAALALAKDITERAHKQDHDPLIIMASGTPFLNAPIELWSLLEILGISDIFAAFAREKLDRTTMEIKNPKFNYRAPASAKNKKIIEVPLTDKGAFEYYFCNAGFDRFDIWQNKGSANVKELHRLLVDTGMIRRRKSDVMHPLPPLGENVVKIDLSDDDWDLYDEVYDEFRDWSVEQAKAIAKEERVSEDVAVRQVLRKLENGEGIMRLTKVRQVLGSGKVPGTVEWIHKFMDGSLIIRHADGHKGPVSDDPTRRKLVLFVHHQEPRRLLIEHPELQQYGILTILPGQEQSGESIQQHKRLFQSDDRHRLIICSMAAREGHTLTAAKDVYLHEIPFVPSWVVQMAGRCWARLSEDFEPHEATVHYAVTDKTEDTRLLQMNRIKKATFNAVIDGEGQDDSIKEIREEDIETLVRAFALGSKQIGVAA